MKLKDILTPILVIGIWTAGLYGVDHLTSDKTFSTRERVKADKPPFQESSEPFPLQVQAERLSEYAPSAQDAADDATGGKLAPQKRIQSTTKCNTELNESIVSESISLPDKQKARDVAIANKNRFTPHQTSKASISVPEKTIAGHEKFDVEQLGSEQLNAQDISVTSEYGCHTIGPPPLSHHGVGLEAQKTSKE